MAGVVEWGCGREVLDGALGSFEDGGRCGVTSASAWAASEGLWFRSRSHAL